MLSGVAAARAAIVLQSTTSAAIAFPVAASCSLGASFLLVTRLERLAGRIGLSEAMLGLVVALAADSPEITSAVTASAHGQTGIGAGVVLGSNVFNLAALLGLGAVVARRISLHRKVVILDGVTATWVALVCVVVISAGLGAAVGLALTLVVVVPYIIISASTPATLLRLGLPARVVAWLHRAVEEEELELAAGMHPASVRRGDIAMASGSLVAVVTASAVMERSAETIGKQFHLSSLIVGGLVLAAVTSLPNAVGAVYLASRGRGVAVLSEAMNSNMLNVLAGLFLPGIFLGLGGAAGHAMLVAGWYAGLTIFSLLVAFAGRGLNRRAGLAIVAGYVAFVIVAVTV